MNSVLFEAWDAFKVSAGNVIRDSFEKIMLLPIQPPDIATNIQACAASVEVYSGAKSEEINNISRQTVAHIGLKVTRTDDHMVVL